MSDAPRAPRGFPLKLDQLKSTPKVLVSSSGQSMASTRLNPRSLPMQPSPASVRTSSIATATQPGSRATPVTIAARAVLRPQAPLAHAARQARQHAPLAGVGLDSAGVRIRMVERLIELGIREPSVLAAMGAVPRHCFVDGALAAQSYEDTSLPIGHAQTISKPSVVSRMIELLAGGRNARALGGIGRVLEIGTGCGYQAAVLARVGKQVFSIERLKALHDRARDTLGLQGIANIRLIHGDGMLGHPPNAPYDSIISAAGGDDVPRAWLDQLAVGGRLVAPVRDHRGQQALVLIDRTETGFERTVRETVQFVPLKSGVVR